MYITDIRAKQIFNLSLDTLTEFEYSLLEQALNHFNQAAVLNTNPLEYKVYESQYFYQSLDQKVGKRMADQLSHFIRFNDYLRVTFMKTQAIETNKASYYVSVAHLIRQAGGSFKKIVSYRDGKLLGENKIETDQQVLETPHEYDVLTEEEVALNDDAISTQSGLPCIQDGCCSFRYNGNPFNPEVNYNWCGANCGSGVPVNDLDTCCRTHDFCYGSFGSYPNRCSCDQTLVDCASFTDNAGTTRVIGAFNAKMFVMGC
ncbi:hypothetical protein [Bacillus fonticola]|uniref:hypothetical protein n=1 Tax=Bacillus fonticola TaxID=2728853 RepID=UPI0014753E50|nr:hypothetical protein [Bacillus fonticola]